MAREQSGRANEPTTGPTERVKAEREQFVAETTVEVVAVKNPNFLLGPDYRPTVTFPDGSHLQFDERTPRQEIQAAIEEAAAVAHPISERSDGEGANKDLKIEEAAVWEAVLFIDGERRSLADILSWEFHFPIRDVIARLDELAAEGWTVAHVSEDRGVYTSKLAANISAPVAARYLLVRDG